MDDVKRFMGKSDRDVLEKNYAKFKEEGVNKDNGDNLKVMNAKLEEELKKVRAEVVML
jgi:hypothetical protein